MFSLLTRCSRFRWRRACVRSERGVAVSSVGNTPWSTWWFGLCYRADHPLDLRADACTPLLPRLSLCLLADLRLHTKTHSNSSTTATESAKPRHTSSVTSARRPQRRPPVVWIRISSASVLYVIFSIRIFNVFRHQEAVVPQIHKSLPTQIMINLYEHAICFLKKLISRDERVAEEEGAATTPRTQSHLCLRRAVLQARDIHSTSHPLRQVEAYSLGHARTRRTRY